MRTPHGIGTDLVDWDNLELRLDGFDRAANRRESGE